MFMNLNSETIKTILENTAKVSDEKAAKIDEILANKDLQKIYDTACPITSEVFEKLKESMADPMNLRLTAVKEFDEFGDEVYDVYIESTEFANYCEATGLPLDEAVESIAEAYDKMVPGISCNRFHVVFPTSKIGADKLLGTSELGLANENTWANKLIRGCQQFGIKANVGVEKKDVNKENDDDVEVSQD